MSITAPAKTQPETETFEEIISDIEVAPEIVHGTANAYNRHRCRCERCADWNRARVNIQRENLSMRTDSEIEADRARIRPHGTKICRQCRTARPFAAYSSNTCRMDGLQDSCGACEGTRRLLWRALRRSGWARHASGLLACAYCGNAAKTMDHYMPLGMGGRDVYANIVPACTSCNTKKGKRQPLDFMREIGIDRINWPSTSTVR